MYVTDTPVIDRLITSEPMEELYRVREWITEKVLDSEEGITTPVGDVLRFVDLFTDELATRLAAIQ